jgi:hypothetical protein
MRTQNQPYTPYVTAFITNARGIWEQVILSNLWPILFSLNWKEWLTRNQSNNGDNYKEVFDSGDLWQLSTIEGMRKLLFIIEC